MALVTPNDIILNASHLKHLSDEQISSVINDVHTLYIARYMSFYPNRVGELTIIEKLLVQHWLTINVRRADSEGVAGMSKSISVPKDLALNQTEYGQMAKDIGKTLDMDWAIDDKEPARLRIY